MRILLDKRVYWDSEQYLENVACDPSSWLIVLRDTRDVLLKESDWTVGVDSPLDESTQQEWVEWRQYMRDITKLYSEENIEGIVEIPDPPKGAPKTWCNVDADYLLPLFEARNNPQPSVIPPAPELPPIVEHFH